jgi:NAD(P)-dependent dehydrogenase (short-subunit alcohol dehydrogenase family)
MTETKTVLVTGASRGIGRAIAEQLLAQGRRVIASARDASALSKFAAQYPERVLPFACDLADPAQASAMGDQVLQRFGVIDQLVCCAGIMRHQPLGFVREEVLRETLQVNFIAPFLLAQTVGTAMRARGQGSIVFVSSTLGEAPAPATSAYAATKAALNQITRVFANELAPAVRVNAVAPGIVDTDMLRTVRNESGDPAQDALNLEREIAAFTALHPLRRLGTPADIAQAVCFVLDASWITGSILTIDGGLLCR